MQHTNSIIMDIAEKHPNTILQISAGDLCDFAHQLIQTVVKIATIQSNKESRQDILTIEEVADILKVSKMTLWRWNKNGKLKKIDIGGMPRYRRSDIDALLNDNNQNYPTDGK